MTGRSLEHESTEALLHALSAKSLDTRAAATYYLGRRASNGELDLIPHLINLLGDPHEEVGEVAVEDLERVGEPAVEQLIAALRDRNRDTTLRGMAARALGNIGDRRAIGPMTAIFLDHEEDAGVRYMSAFYLGRLGDESAIDHLGTVLISPDAPSKVRAGAAAALMELADTRAVPFLRAVVNDADVGISAKIALARVEKRLTLG